MKDLEERQRQMRERMARQSKGGRPPKMRHALWRSAAIFNPAVAGLSPNERPRILHRTPRGPKLPSAHI
jgi:hypothetical protein